MRADKNNLLHPLLYARIGEAETFQKTIRYLALIFEVLQLGDYDQVFPHGQNLVHGGKLRGVTDRLPHAVRH